MVSKTSQGTCFVYITLVFGGRASLSKEVCLYAGADWLKLICQSEGGEGSIGQSLTMLIRRANVSIVLPDVKAIDSGTRGSGLEPYPDTFTFPHHKH